ncbi:hypothetical protein BD410DRAFT_847253 [Rickenella mellea]|uniref:Uncharacterized protein n=1 Tax=Rickenella mellea TaxID=50990 RepID=A0A4Y7PD21_9AGAM|nr:hypothetical protein BD410DRAFT_847253 [Rickenella mellea]
MTPALTVFSSTASPYDYDMDEDNEGRKKGLLERLKRWTEAFTYSPAAGVDGRIGGKAGGRMPELEAGVLYSSIPHHSLNLNLCPSRIRLVTKRRHHRLRASILPPRARRRLPRPPSIRIVLAAPDEFLSYIQ